MSEVGIASAVFLRSDQRHDAMPPVPPDAPEVAFLGKSNVGKSSLMNALTLKRDLVKTSKTPGHTQLINQFGVTLKLRRATAHVTLVDLPGYGFAKVPRAQQQKLTAMIGGYLSQRQGLRALVHLFDLRHPPTALDVSMWQQLAVLFPARIVVGTKADRVPKAKQREHASVLAKALGIAVGDVVIASAQSRQGRVELWQRIVRAAFDDAEPLLADAPAGPAAEA